MKRRRAISYWVEGAVQHGVRLDPRNYYERVAGTIAAIHERQGAFSDDRWAYLAQDLRHVHGFLDRYPVGRILDLGCGAGHWIDHYGHTAKAITLVDVSPKLLASASLRAELHLGLPTKGLVIDAFLEPEKLPVSGQDTIFCAFLLSHYSTMEVIELLHHIRRKADPGTRLLVIDSWFAPAKRTKRPRESMRSVVDGGVRYAVLKRYCTKSEWASIVGAAQMKILDQWWGNAFFACQCVVAP